MHTDTLRLRWATPAPDWTHAAPVGNGRLGAMVLGGADGRCIINDATVWSGEPGIAAAELDRVIANGAGPDRLAQVRAALAAGDVRTAEHLLLAFQGRYSQEFLPFVELTASVAGATDGDRVLDLDHAVVTETFDVGGTAVVRRTWASAPAQALFVELVADEPVLDVEIGLTSQLHVDDAWVDRADGVCGIDIVAPIDGAPLHEQAAAAHSWSDAGWDAFASAAVAVRTDGAVTRTSSGLGVQRARRLTITLSSSSRAASWWAGRDGEGPISRKAIRATAISAAVAAAGDDAAFARHVADLTALTPATFSIGGRRAGEWDVRDDVLYGSDDALRATVMAEYGRYLITASSRAGGPAANLQGIWNADLRPAWSSNYTVNINTQMNYWGASATGLIDPAEPLLSLVERIAASGTDVARRLYGARGWVCHHNSDLWGWSLPVGDGHGGISWAQWPMGGVWLVLTAWDQYAYTLDIAVLERIWPVLRGATEFALDWLIPTADGTRVTSPSTSPENMFIADDGLPTAIGDTAVMDLALIGTLLERTLVAIDVLALTEPTLVDEVRTALDALPAETVGPDGRLREWAHDQLEHEPHHRHLSNLVGLHPLDRITPRTTPTLAAAAVRFLDARGPGAMGWSWAWKTAMRARLGQGDVAASLLHEAFTPFEQDNAMHASPDGSTWGGLLPNLWSTHPPFQIDGNYGFTAAIAEMLVQAGDGQDTVEVLPACAPAWTSGRATGLRVRGGLAVDLDWDALGVRAQLHNLSVNTRDVRVRHGADMRTVHLPPNGVATATFSPQDSRSSAEQNPPHHPSGTHPENTKRYT